MNDDIRKDLYYELTPEEEAAVDRVLNEAANAADFDVDYASIYRRVKARAANEGLVVFPGARKADSRKAAARKAARKRNALRRVLTGVAAAAAVFVMGFGVYGAVRHGILPGLSSKEAQAPQEQLAAADSTEKRGGSSSAPTENARAEETAAPVYSPAPVQTESGPMVIVWTDEPVPATDEPITPEPTEYAAEDMTFGFVELGAFDTAPDELQELVPEMLPDMEDMRGSTGGGEDPLQVFVTGAIDGEGYDYTCEVLPEVDEELAVGFARFEQTAEGELIYIWRVTDTTCLKVSLTSFDREGAEMLLSRFALDNRIASRMRAVPTLDPNTEVGE